MTLVVGATGQPGSPVVGELGRLGQPPLRTVEQVLREKAALPPGN